MSKLLPLEVSGDQTLEANVGNDVVINLGSYRRRQLHIVVLNVNHMHNNSGIGRDPARHFRTCSLDPCHLWRPRVNRGSHSVASA